MCGIVGIVGNNNFELDSLSKMVDTLVHRGPDSNGLWYDNESNIALGHTRLSILDLSNNGSQPMKSVSGRFTVIFNGEIYNHIEIRDRLLKKNINIKYDKFYFRGNSDTETLLASIECLGLTETLNILDGMFSFAVWDKKRKKLYLARDKLGEKPLYYGFQNKIFLFASELKAIKKHPSFLNNINNEAVSQFIKYSYIPTPNSIYKDIYKLRPGSLLEFDVRKKSYDIFNYWQISDKKESLNSTKFINETDCLKEFEKRLSNSVKKQQLSDVPIGSFLSSGIDSTLVTAIMQNQNTNPINTFSIGYNEVKYDESQNAKRIANFLGTNHHEIIVDLNNISDVILSINKYFDEPFADSSQIPSLIISNFASKHVKVALTGDGGDELFGGYNRYLWSKRISKIPIFLKLTIMFLLKNISEKNFVFFYKKIENFIPKNYRVSYPDEKYNKLKNILLSKPGLPLYRKLITIVEDTKSLIKNYDDIDHILDKWNIFEGNLDDVSIMMLTDIQTYLTDDILCKNDRSSMASSLELRAPFLSNDVLNFSLSLDNSYKIRNGQTKWISRELAKKFIPSHLIDTPKKGFSFPIEKLLKNNLKEWSYSLIDHTKINNSGYLNSIYINKLWDDFLSGKNNKHHEIWNILMFQSWLTYNDYCN